MDDFKNAELGTFEEELQALVDYGHDCCARIDDAINELADNIEAEVAERYVALPLDADGVPIRVGDDMETLMVGHEGDHSPVEWVSLTADGWNVDGEPPTSMRHYHEPTVESTLRELVADMWLQLLNAYDRKEVDEFVDRMRELGVEVDE